jgi:hypothetical protein
MCLCIGLLGTEHWHLAVAQLTHDTELCHHANCNCIDMRPQLRRYHALLLRRVFASEITVFLRLFRFWNSLSTGPRLSIAPGLNQVL